MSVSREPQTLEEWKEAYFAVLKQLNETRRAPASAGMTADSLERQADESARERLIELLDEKRVIDRAILSGLKSAVSDHKAPLTVDNAGTGITKRISGNLRGEIRSLFGLGRRARPSSMRGIRPPSSSGFVSSRTSPATSPPCASTRAPPIPARI